METFAIASFQVKSRAIPCNVELQIEHAPKGENYDPQEYVDGVRIIGEFSYDRSAGADQYANVLHPAVSGDLTVFRDGQSTKFSILIVEKSGETTIRSEGREKQVLRCFWRFYAVGKLHWDRIGLFNETFAERKARYRVYFCDEFRPSTPWASQGKAVVVARDEVEAERLLVEELDRRGVPRLGKLTVQELSLEHTGVLMLDDGE